MRIYNTTVDIGAFEAQPYLSVSPTTLNLGTANAGTASSPAQTYTVSGTDLTAPVVVTAPTDVELSLNGTTYSSALTLTPSSGGFLASTTIDVRISASASAGSISGSVTNTSTGATEMDVTVSGMVTLAAPTVTTPTDTSITTTTATLGGDVTSAGGATITEYGVVYAPTATNSNPQVGGTGVTVVDTPSSVSGTFTENVTGLSPLTGYSFAAFAINSVGTSYTSVATFTTTAPSGYYEVTTNADNSNAVDFAHAGTSGDPYLAPSLRSAINAGDDATGAVTIVFESSLTSSSSATITLSTVGNTTAGLSDFGVTGNITIVGPTGSSYGITLANSGSQRLFYVSPTGNLTLENLTLSGGMAQGGNGGGGAAGMGGAVFNQGTLQLIQSTLSGNTAQGGSGYPPSYSNGGGGLGGNGVAYGNGGGPNGGAYGAGTNGGAGGFGGGGGATNPFGGTGGAGGFGGGGGTGYMGGGGGFGGGAGGSEGFNRAQGGFGGGYGGLGYGGSGSGSAPVISGNGAGMGGAIFNAAGTVTITNTTLSGNTAKGGAGGFGGSGFGGAVFNLNGSISLLNSTLSGNTVAPGTGYYTGTAAGGALYTLGINGVYASGYGTGATIGTAAGAIVSATNTIFANSTGGLDLVNNGSTFSGSNNLATQSTGLPTGVSSTTTTALNLASSLANNGGPTETLALLYPSSAIDQGIDTTQSPYNLTTDQRGPGFARKVGAQVDIGAYEFVPTVPVVTSPTSTTINPTTESLGGNVTFEGGAPLSKRGILYSVTATNANPQLGGNSVTEVDDAAATTGVFTETVSGLSAGTHYSFVAFATNSYGTTYTSPVSTFTIKTPLGTTSLLEGPEAGIDSDILAYAGSWTVSVSPSATWLHLTSAASGSGNTLVTFSFDANAGGTRMGTITIAGFTLTVTQAGSTYVAANPVITLVSTAPYSPYGIAVDGADNLYFTESNLTLQEWNAATQTTTTLASGLSAPRGVAVDATGNVYFTDPGELQEWNATTHTVITLASSGLSSVPAGVALDAAGNAYIADFSGNAIKEWNATTHTISTLIPGVANPAAVAVDAAGNVYYQDAAAVKEWNATTHVVTTLISSISGPDGLAVDGSGNLYITDYVANTLDEWHAATQTLTTIASGFNIPREVAVDSTGNVFIVDANGKAIKEQPRAFVATAAFSEGAASGSDSLPVVLPATENLTGIFAPTSDQSWLTIGSVTSGVVNFSFTANPGAARTAHITVLGQQIAVNQAAGPATYAESLDSSGNLVITQTVAGNNDNLSFTLSGGNYLFTDTGGLLFGTPSGAGASFIGGGGTITITIPSADVNSISVTLGTGTNVFTFTGTDAAAAPITVNTGTTTGDQVNITGTVTDSGAVSLTSNAISESGSGGLSISGTLTTSSATGTTLSGAGSNAIGTFNATNSTSGNVSLTNTSGTLTVSGINETGGTITVNNTGAISISGAISNLSGNSVNLTASTSIAESSSGLVSTTGALTTQSAAGTTLSGRRHQRRRHLQRQQHHQRQH